MKLEEAEAPIRAALERLAESPRALLCYVIIESPITGRFVQFCTPPPPSRFAHSPRIQTGKPLIFDGTGVTGKPSAYESVQAPCDLEPGTTLALMWLGKYLPPDAELHIVEESTRTERPS